MWVSLTGGSLAGRIAWWNPRLHVRPRRHDRLRLLSVPKEDQEDGERHVRVWLMWQDIPEEQFPAATQIRAHRYGCAACHICSSLHLMPALVWRKGWHMLSLSTGEMCSTFYFFFLVKDCWIFWFWCFFSSHKIKKKKKGPILGGESCQVWMQRPSWCSASLRARSHTFTLHIRQALKLRQK